MKEWFESWFDTPYYHILYKNRDFEEAELFIENLFDVLALDAKAEVLDLACGQGRHAIFVNSLGYRTTGVDLSARSIEQASKVATDTLDFFQHDMRYPIENRKFDLVLNLFTSFGYFGNKSDNIDVLKSVFTYLRPHGLLVIDFMNAKKEINQLVNDFSKIVDGIEFKISKQIEDDNIVKDIEFEANGEQFHYQEKVQLLTIEDFEDFLTAANFEIKALYGNYQLDAFTEDADRLIILAKKITE